mmetsp:Transcript_18532/g.41027  ORF Transcript_18532/g.41027 Transcript_18532/m.41027 type:complete len:994 (+) Transcript_18532:95-3076(+)
MAGCFCSWLCSSVARCCRGFAKSVRANKIAFLVFVLLLAVVLGAIFGITYAFSLVLTIPGAIALDILLLWLLLRWIVRMIVFPGSTTCFRRQLEVSHDQDMAKQLQTPFAHLRRMLEFFDEQPSATGRAIERDEELDFTFHQVSTAYRMLLVLRRNFATQQEDGCRLTPDQSRLQTLANQVLSFLESGRMHAAPEHAGEEPGLETITEFLGRRLVAKDLQRWALHPDDRAAAREVYVRQDDWRQCSRCRGRKKSSRIWNRPCVFCGGTGQERGGIAGMLTLLKSERGDSNCCGCKPMQTPPVLLGSLDFLRAELICRYDGVRCRIPSGDINRNVIDGMIIPRIARPGRAAPVPTGDRAPATEPIDISEEVVMIMSGPNASVYETYVFRNAVLNFYLSLGFTVFLFNYRGFGRSTGFATTTKVARDGEVCVEYLKKVYNVKKFAIHGRSMGGYVACHLACKFKNDVQLLIADRTFASLQATASSIYGTWAAYGLRFVFASGPNFKNYESATCYKVVVSDPKDATIPDVISLRSRAAIAALASLPSSKKVELEKHECQTLVQAWNSLVEYARKHLPHDAKVDEDHEDDMQASDAVRQPLMASGESHCGPPEVGTGDTTEQDLESGQAVTQPALSPLVQLVLDTVDAAGRVNAGGHTLKHCLSGQFNQVDSLQVWLGNLQVFGSRGRYDLHLASAWKQSRAVSNGVPADPAKDNRVLRPLDIAEFGLYTAYQSVERSRSQLEDLGEMLNNLRGVCPAEDVDMVQSSLQRIRHLMDQLHQHFLGKSTPFSLIHDEKVAGFCVHCTCGHNGSLSDSEMEQVRLHIIESGVVPQRAPLPGETSAQDKTGRKGRKKSRAPSQPGAVPNEPCFQQGAKVVLHGLSSEAGSKLNGCVGITKGYHDARKRLQIELPSGEVKLIKPENVRLFADSEEHASCPTQEAGPGATPALRVDMAFANGDDRERSDSFLNCDGFSASGVQPKQPGSDQDVVPDAPDDLPS